ncbi:MAG TPA: AAA family ATPase [Candidatus Polarisedimenticolia bacterium]|nr:AAA family ATPase [Candidatus Polarisedimenticolia bacterium]
MEGPRSSRAFVGRASELEQLDAALDAATSRHGRVVIVAGEAGVGKTRLLNEFEARARSRGARVLEGACLDLGAGALPYGPFVEVLRELVRSTEAARLPALLGPARAEITRLVPELAGRSAELRPAGEFDASAQSRLFELTLGILERVSEQAPLVLMIEDLQWADRASLDLLAFLARGLEDNPALIVVSVRTDDLGSHASALAALAELERDSGVDRIDLLPFGRDDLAVQLSELTGAAPAPDVIDRVLERSDGNPFFVEELVAAGFHRGAELPARLRDVLAARLSGLPVPSLRMLRAAAVAGRRIDDGLMCAALGLEPVDLADGLRPAVAAGLLSRAPSAGGRFQFRHALLQEFIADELFPTERTAMHAAFAGALETRLDKGDGSVVAADLARHWDASGDAAKALVATIAAAQEADLVFAFSDATRHWERALELWAVVAADERPTSTDEPELRHRAAEAAVLSGEYRRALEHGRAAAALVKAADDPERAAFLNEKLRWYAWEAGDRAAAAVSVREALVLLEGTPPSASRARALAHLAGIEMYARDYEASVRDATEAVAVARAAEALGEEALALGVLGWATAVLGDVAGGVETFRRGMAIAADLGAVEGMSLAATNLASLLDRVGRSEDSLRAAEEGYEAVSRLGVGRTYGGLLLGFAAKAQLALGRWDDAERTTANGLRRGAAGRAALWLSINRGRVLLGRGRFSEASAVLSRARELDRELGETEFRSALHAAIVELAVWRGDSGAAWPDVAEGLARVRSGEMPDPSLAWLAALGLRAEADIAATARARNDEPGLAVATARGAEIGAVVERGLSAAPELSRDTGRGIALATLIVAERARLAGGGSAAEWASVADAWARVGRPFPTAYARFREAEAHLLARDRHAAESAARSGHELAVRLGAAPLVVELERLARLGHLDLGGHAAPDIGSADPGDAFGFTSRESEVLQLVAGGWTNQQIADALFISRKTASVHVSNILGKLGVDSRVEAAAIAHRIGIAKDAPPPPDAP